MPAIAFGRLRLLAAERLLLDADKPVHIGSRALTLLVALVNRPGEILTNQELMGRIWPDSFVEEVNLRVHVAALRKALKDGHDGARSLVNLPGRGYRFVAPVSRATMVQQAASNPRLDSLPVPLTRTMGRDEVVAALVSSLRHHRSITIVGPGGIGKMTVALTYSEARRRS